MPPPRAHGGREGRPAGGQSCREVVVVVVMVSVEEGGMKHEATVKARGYTVHNNAG